jgi:hypothetical protein
MPVDKLAVMGRPKKPEPSDPIRAPRSFVRKVRRLALQAGMDPGDYLATEFGDAIDRRHAKMIQDLAREQQSDDKQV